MQAWNTCFGKSSISSQASAEMHSTLRGMFGIFMAQSVAGQKNPRLGSSLVVGGAECSRFPAWLGQKGALRDCVDLTGLESLHVTQAGTVRKCGSAAAARAPVQPIRELGNCLMVSQ